MARDSYDETVSIKQANAIGDRVNEIVALAKTKITAKSDEFVNVVSENWEDKNAVDFANAYKRNMEGIIDNLGTNNKTFFSTLKDIVNSYAQAGGLSERFGKDPIVVSTGLGVGKVKEAFGDGSFGFKGNNIHVPEAITEKLEELAKEVRHEATETVQKLNSINAFGNFSIQRNIAASGGELLSITEENLKNIRKDCNTFLQKTASMYAKVGSAGAQSSNIQVTMHKK